MAKDSLFRTSLSGFNKQDVTEYIEELNIRYNRQTEELEGEINSLKKELEVLPVLQKAKEEKDKLAAENHLYQKEISDLNEAVKAQGEVALQKDERIKALENEVELLKGQLSSLHQEKAKLDTYVAQLKEESSKEAIELEEVLSQARKEACEVVEKAKSFAHQIVDNAKERAKEESELAIRKSDEAVRDNLKKVKFLSKKKEELNDIFKSHKDQMDSFFSSISGSLKGDK